MPTKAMPSSWKPKGIELLKVRKLYPDCYIEALAALVTDNLIGDELRKFKNQILRITGELNADLYYMRRPTATQSKAALDKVEHHLTKLRAVLKACDHDSQQLLAEIAGDDRYRDTSKSLNALAWWVRKGRRRFQKGTTGRKPEMAIQRAVDGLCEVWTERMGKKPTLSSNSLRKETSGPFMVFVKKALDPVIKSYDSKGRDYEHHIRAAIYGGNRS